jgi:polysaccharide chain length determinant protein (PEP-CTERM system associated)
VAWLVCGAGWVGVYSIQNKFESNARLFVDADAVLTPLLKGLAADSSPATQLDVLQHTLLSRPNLDKLISKTGMDLTLGGQSDRDRLINRLATDIKVTPQTRNLFTIAYRDPSPRLAYDVVQTLLTLFIESATGGSRTDLDNARHFLEHQIQSYEEQLRAAEKRRADFRAKYIDILPSDSSPNVPALDGARVAAQQLDGKLQDALLTRDALQREVNGTAPLIVVEAGSAGPGLPPARSKLEDAEDQLRLLLLKDTDQHPDVIAQRRLIDALKKDPTSTNPRSAGTGQESGFPRRSLPNPVYDQLKIKLIEAETTVTSLQRQRDEAVAYRGRLEVIQREQPSLIAEYQNMDRDYNVLRHNYEELLSRLQSANIAQAADTQADKVKLQIVDPPQVPRVPVAPNRALLITGVLVGGIGCGLAAAVLLGQFDRSFATIEELRKIGLPVLGGVAILEIIPLRSKILAGLRVGVAFGVLVCLYGGLMAHILRASLVS